MLKKYKCFCFDFDGTLIQSNQVKKHFFDDLYSKYLISDELRAELEAAASDRFSIFDKIKNYSESRNLNLDLDKYKLSIELDNRVMASQLYPGALILLNDLNKKNVDCFLISATPVASLHKIVEQKDLKKYFKNIFGWPIVKHRKLKELSEKYKSSIVMIGDGVDDKQAADFAEVDFISVGEGRGSRPGETNFSMKQISEMYKRD